MHKTASFIAEIFSPFFLAGFLVALITVRTDPHPALAATIALVFVAGIPQLLSIFMHRAGRVSDRFVRVREQRTPLYLMTLGSLAMGTIAINLVPTSGDVRLSLNLAVATVVIALVINLFIKVSIHALMSDLVAVVAPFYLPTPAIFWVVGALVWGVTVWAHYYNRRHTLTELALGSLLGLGLALLFLVLR